MPQNYSEIRFVMIQKNILEYEEEKERIAFHNCEDEYCGRPISWPKGPYSTVRPKYCKSCLKWYQE